MQLQQINILRLAQDLTQTIIAEYYYNLEPNKYTRSERTGWYEFNQYNVLVPKGGERTGQFVK